MPKRDQKENHTRAAAKRRRKTRAAACGGGDACSSSSVTTAPVQVVVRLRPLLASECAAEAALRAAEDEFGHFSIACVNGGSKQKQRRGSVGAPTVRIQKPYADERRFQFSDVIEPEATQRDVFERICGPKLIEQVTNGINGTVLCYGQTGAGKTYTIFGASAPASECGVVPRLIHELFANLGANAEVKVAFLQIYNEQLRDLLAEDPDASRPQIREQAAVRADGGAAAAVAAQATVFVEGNEIVVVKSARAALRLIDAAAQYRYSAATSMNKASSRSHAVIQIFVEQTHDDAPRVQTLDPVTGRAVVRKTRGVLTVVDLAGSERVGRSKSAGARLTEACHINKSISALGNCIAALADAASSRSARTHVPFRDAVLTRLLTNSLGGNSMTVICANVSPLSQSFEETHSTLLFARRAMRVKNRVAQNEVIELAPPLPVAAAASAAAAAAAAAAAEPQAIPRSQELQNELEAEMELLFNENRRAFAENVSLRTENAALHAALHEARRVVKQQQQQRPAAAAAGPSSSAPGQLWERREHELVQKFSVIIESLKNEVARQTAYIDTLRQPSHALKEVRAAVVSFLSPFPLLSPAHHRPTHLQQASASLLSIPEIRAFISERLGGEAADAKAAPAREEAAAAAPSAPARTCF